MKLPRHIALIPDGNRRWARKRGLSTFFGHRSGAKNFVDIMNACMDMGVEYVTLWGCSVDNLTKRDPKEVKFLIRIFEDKFRQLLKDKRLEARDIRVDILGEWRDYFTKDGVKVMNQLIDKTKDHKKFHMTFLMAYSGVEDMVNAVKRIAARGTKSEINSETIKRSLWTKDLPAVDLIIRTGGEPHWSSGFMMWDAANSQLYFTPTLWPAFSTKELQHAIGIYAGTERRMGK